MDEGTWFCVEVERSDFGLIVLEYQEIWWSLRLCRDECAIYWIVRLLPERCCRFVDSSGCAERLGDIHVADLHVSRPNQTFLYCLTALRKANWEWRKN